MNRKVYVPTLISLVVSLGTLIVHAEPVYKSTMPDGKVLYGNAPAPGAKKVEKMTMGTELRAQLVLEGAPRALPALWGEYLLRIGQEVLTNSLRHASASEFKVHLSFLPDQVRLLLRDNGNGFDLGRKHDGFGLVGIRERVEGMNGQLTIESGKAKGTTISIALPYANNLS